MIDKAAMTLHHVQIFPGAAFNRIKLKRLRIMCSSSQAVDKSKHYSGTMENHRTAL